MIYETIKMAYTNLKLNKFRSFLSILGIVIGVMAVIAIVSIGSGAQREVTGQIANLGTNIITILPGMVSGDSGKITTKIDEIFPLKLAPFIEQTSPSVKTVVPIIQGSVLLYYQNNNLQAKMVATRPDYGLINNYHPERGRFFIKEDLNKNIIVLGSEVSKEIFEDKNPIGQNIKVSINNKRLIFTIIGVMEKRGVGLMDNFDTQVYIPISTYMNKIKKTKYVNFYMAQTYSTQESISALGQIEYFLLKNLGDRDKFNLLSQDQVMDILKEVAVTLNLMLGGMASISLLVGGIGIMNIMLVSVTERTKEIGIRKALGAKKKNIIRQFLIEALFLSGFGGIIGIILGSVIALVICIIGDWPLVISPFTIIFAFAFAILTGLFFGIYPAIKAAKLDPVDALSYE